MGSNPLLDEVVVNLLTHAKKFHDANPDVAGVNPTFGYFTHHPVAPLNRKRLVGILRQVEDRSAKLGRRLKVLDLCSGGGLIATAISTMGHQVVGADLSENETQLARTFAVEASSSARFEIANLVDDKAWEKNLETALDGKPDVIVLAYALHHLPRVEQFIVRLNRWLPRSTLLVINEENPVSPTFRLKHWVRTQIQKDTETEWHRSYPEWKGLLESQGFIVSPAQGYDLIPGLATWLPSSAWSLVFTAEKR